jgi:hypothetical protein
MRIPVFLPNFLQVVLLLRKPFVVLEGTYIADEDSVLHHKVRRLPLHAVDAELVELVFEYFLVEVSHKFGILLLGKMSRDTS